MTERRTLTLTDPRAIRVLAHEVRQQLLDELSGGTVLTATEAKRKTCAPRQNGRVASESICTTTRSTLRP